MFKKINVFADKYKLFDDTSKYVVGVSGGSDSMLLVEYLLTRLGSGRLVVAHVNHGFREQSKEEYMFVDSYCKRNGLVFEGLEADVSGYMELTGKSAQVASREVRYGFYRDVMSRHGIDLIVLGHHGDDLIETVIMRNIVGSGSRGLVGMLPKSRNELGEVIRPLLCMTKDEIYEMSNSLKLTWYEDPSNKKDTYVRNRIRNNILPELKKENDCVHGNFLKVSLEREEDNAFIEGFVDRFYGGSVRFKDSVMVVERGAFNQLDMAVKKRVVKRLLGSLVDGSVSRDVVDKVIDMAEGCVSTDFRKMCENVYVVFGNGSMYVMDRDRVDGIESGELVGADSSLERLSGEDRFENGKRVVKDLKAKKVCEAFRKNAFVIRNSDGSVCDVMYFDKFID